MRRPFCHRCRRQPETPRLKGRAGRTPPTRWMRWRRRRPTPSRTIWRRRKSLYVTGRGPSIRHCARSRTEGQGRRLAFIGRGNSSSGRTDARPRCSSCSPVFPRRGVSRPKTPPSKAWSKRYDRPCVQWVAMVLPISHGRTARGHPHALPLAMPSPTRWCSLLAWYPRAHREGGEACAGTTRTSPTNLRKSDE